MKSDIKAFDKDMRLAGKHFKLLQKYLSKSYEDILPKSVKHDKKN